MGGGGGIKPLQVAWMYTIVLVPKRKWCHHVRVVPLDADAICTRVGSVNCTKSDPVVREGDILITKLIRARFAHVKSRMPPQALIRMSPSCTTGSDLVQLTQGLPRRENIASGQGTIYY